MAATFEFPPGGDKIVCEINGTFHPVLASIFQASTSITVKVQEVDGEKKLTFEATGEPAPELVGAAEGS